LHDLDTRVPAVLQRFTRFASDQDAWLGTHPVRTVVARATSETVSAGTRAKDARFHPTVAKAVSVSPLITSALGHHPRTSLVRPLCCGDRVTTRCGDRVTTACVAWRGTVRAAIRSKKQENGPADRNRIRPNHKFGISKTKKTKQTTTARFTFRCDETVTRPPSPLCRTP
jgi:hypothetical protein